MLYKHHCYSFIYWLILPLLQLCLRRRQAQTVIINTNSHNIYIINPEGFWNCINIQNLWRFCLGVDTAYWGNFICGGSPTNGATPSSLLSWTTEHGNLPVVHREAIYGHIHIILRTRHAYKVKKYNFLNRDNHRETGKVNHKRKSFSLKKIYKLLLRSLTSQLYF